MRGPEFCLAGLLLALTVACVVTSTAVGERVRIVGSDTMLILNRRLAESFMRSHPGVSVEVRGGGTGSGVEALLAGEAEICAASRPLAATEVAALHRRFASLGMRFVVAQDALSVYLNPANPVRDLSSAQLRGLFTGRIRSWAEVGGPDLVVVPVVRPPNSGTQRFFRDHVLRGDDYAAEVQVAARTVDVIRVVGDDPAAVGFGGEAYATASVVQCRVDGVAPSSAEVSRGRYPLSRFLLYFTVEAPRGAARKYIDWCLGPSGQQLVAETGYLPLWPR